ncbi:kinase-like protein [Hesseltinella vesiculosa]|uniref:Kinase-like protein n=1 Tax=Hesseltinella vesiculosa TaxID=101127 RepID=A0A1X2G2N1_9FUNG|nr:kinase-like protein [Hesseltinella vesiculosa]
MDHSILIRKHPHHQYQLQVIKTELVHRTIERIRQLLVQYPGNFDIHFLPPPPHTSIPAHEAIANLYNNTIAEYRSNNIPFDDHWHWNIAWRQALSLDSLLLLAQGNQQRLIQSFHPKCHRVLQAIFHHDLARYMRFYPWKWFSDLVFVGAGGFSAVYAANISLLFDVPEPGRTFGSLKRGVAVKVVDEKILNEITVQSRAFLALLFHGLTLCESTGDLLMIGTLAEGGNLESHIDGPVPESLDLTSVADTVTRLAFHLASLHDDIRMCHRNIHPQNVLCVDDDYLLVDYRFSTASNEATEVSRQAKAHYGRLPYIAPELHQGIYTEKSDVFSLGVIMWQLVSRIPFPRPEIVLDQTELYKIEWVPGVPQWYMELTMACLEPKPEHRPIAEDVGLIARKYAAANKSHLLTDDQNWLAYVQQRRQACHAHVQQCKRKWKEQRQQNQQPSANQSALPHPPLEEEDDEEIGASRLYSFRSLPTFDTFLSLPFHHRPFDPVNINF